MKTITFSITLLLAAGLSAQAQTEIRTGRARLKTDVCMANKSQDKKINPLYSHCITRGPGMLIDRENSAAQKTQSTATAALMEVKAFPNPFSTQIDIIITDGEMEKSVYKAELYDLSGKKVYGQTLVANQSSLQLSQLSAGAYLLRIEKNGAMIKQEKFIKQ